MNTVELIHKEFKESFEESEKALVAKIEQLRDTMKPEMSDSINQLYSLGFSNSKSVVETKNKALGFNQSVSNLNKFKDLQTIVDNLRLKYPYKIISYGQIIRILEKYNLYISKSNNYIDAIPEANAKQILDYTKNVKSNIQSGHYTGVRPIAAQDVEKNSAYRTGYNDNFYVCGLFDMFKQSDNRFVVGKEIFHDHELDVKFKYEAPKASWPDPVVLQPLYTGNEIGDSLKLFHIVTAWGPEASDPIILDHKNN